MQRDNDAGGQLFLSLLLSAHNRMVKYLEIVFSCQLEREEYIIKEREEQMFGPLIPNENIN